MAWARAGNGTPSRCHGSERVSTAGFVESTGPHISAVFLANPEPQQVRRLMWQHMRTLVWFREKDLRLQDHPAFRSSLAGEVIPVFVLEPDLLAPERARLTAHRVQFLLESLRELSRALESAGSRLVLARGESVAVIPKLARYFRVERVAAQSWVAPVGRQRDGRVRDALSVPLDCFDHETLVPPGSIVGAKGKPLRVFTAFAKIFARTARIADPCALPPRIPPLPADVSAALARRREIGGAPPELAELGIAHEPRLLTGGESAAARRLTAFIEGTGRTYHTTRDRLDLATTSRLSADLRFGTLSPHTVWHAARRLPADARAAFQNELVWREFTHAVLWHQPELLSEPFRPSFEGFPWREDAASWLAWTLGTTGYPIVDASARQLLGEGFVHNRARMISASFLTKHLLIHYQRGEDHYMRHLTDGDWAQNNAGWQWSAGSGVDAQPYFRIFNPVTQGQKFDPEGSYVRRWVPELARVPARYIHAPWLAPPEVLAAAGLRLGRDYPTPIVDHAFARQRFLDTAKRHLSRISERDSVTARSSTSR